MRAPQASARVRIGATSEKHLFTITPLVRAELRSRLMALSYRAYVECGALLLSRLGYLNVEVAGRNHLTGRRPNRGRDLEACIPAGLHRSRVIVQLKQYDRPVQKRFVDELRGTMLRIGAEQGMIITTSVFSPRADRQRNPNAVSGIVPVRLVDGEELIDLLVGQRIGLIRTNKGKGQLTIDQAFFDRLEARFPPITGHYGGDHRRGLPHDARRHWRDRQPFISFDFMLWQSHILAGIASLWAVDLLMGGIPPDILPPCLAAAVFGALLPDLDAPHSKLAATGISGIYPFEPLSCAVHRRFGHRGIMHSCAVAVVVIASASVLAVWLDARIAAALALGYVSHLALDACTLTGIPLSGANKRGGRRVHLLPSFMRIRTGAPEEDIVLVLLAATALLFLLAIALAK